MKFAIPDSDNDNDGKFSTRIRSNMLYKTTHESDPSMFWYLLNLSQLKCANLKKFSEYLTALRLSPNMLTSCYAIAMDRFRLAYLTDKNGHNLSMATKSE